MAPKVEQYLLKKDEKKYIRNPNNQADEELCTEESLLL